MPVGDPEEAGKLKPADRFLEVGNKLLWRSSGFDRREFLPQLRGRRGTETYREMLDNDPVVGGVMFAIEMLLRRVEWTVEPCATGPDGESTDYDIERADFLNECMGDLSHSWEEFISDALTMLPFGFAFMEIVYKKRIAPGEKVPAERRSDYSDGKIGWRKFVLIPQDTVNDWVLDDHGGIQAAKQYHGAGLAVIPIQKALMFRTTRRNPTGRSALRSAYRPWYMRKRIEEIEGIGIERDLAGLPVIYFDPDTSDSNKAQYQTIVRNVRRDEQEGVLIPAVYDEQGNHLTRLELLTSGGSRQFDTDLIVQRYVRHIAMTLLQDVILLGHEKTGTQALASEKRDLSDTALQAWLNEIAAVLNTHAVPRLFELNGMDLADLPRFCPGELRPTDVAEFADSLLKACQAGFSLQDDPEIEAEVRRRLGLAQMLPELKERMTEDMLNPPEPVVVAPPGTGGQPPEEGKPDE